MRAYYCSVPPLGYRPACNNLGDKHADTISGPAALGITVGPIFQCIINLDLATRLQALL